MKVISLASAKGGVGKSTLAVNLAAAMVEDGKSVLILDMDPQGSAMLWDELRTRRVGWPLPPLVKSMTLSGLRAALRAASLEGTDYVVLDMPGISSKDVEETLRFSDLVLVPSRASIIDIAPATITIEAAMRLGKTFCYVMNFVPEDKTMYRAVKSQLEDAGLMVAATAIPDSQTFPSAFMWGKTAIEQEPDGAAAKEIRWLWRFLKGLV